MRGGCATALQMCALIAGVLDLQYPASPSGWNLAQVCKGSRLCKKATVAPADLAADATVFREFDEPASVIKLQAELYGPSPL